MSSIEFDSHILVITADEVLSPSVLTDPDSARDWKVRAPEHLAAVLTRWRPRSLPIDGKKRPAPRSVTSSAPNCWDTWA